MISWIVLPGEQRFLKVRHQVELVTVSFCLLKRGVGRALVFILFLLTAHCSLPTLQAQTPEPVDTIRIDTDLVNLNVSVVNRNAAMAAGHLEQKDFAVFENGAPQEILFFASEDAPFDLVLLLDLSGSTADKIGLIRKSAKRFVDAAPPADRIAIFVFTSEIEVVSKLTNDHNALKKSIEDIEKPSGGTNFWDALRFVLEHVVGQSRAENRRSAVVVMTDGVDNALPGVYGDGSSTSFEDLLKIVQRLDTIVLPIYLDTEGKHGNLKEAYALARQQLAMLAAESGNVIYQAKKVKDLEGVYQQVIRDLSMVYSIGYRPGNLVRDGSWRAVSVQLLGHPDLTVRAKRGYYGK
ncbi:MAG TPA: VWA domain-containing protein [Pyrinomonadaceae bacterium]|nr:VWA domain-containing protein [Pyrinomonadaceae bacterium]